MQQRYQKCYLFFLGLFFSASLFAQQQPASPRSIHPMELEITCDQTSVLLFPAAITSVDRGSRDILTKTVKDVTNVLKLKAASDSMQPSSLHVFTADGQVYAFIVCYHPRPPHLTIDLSNTTSGQESPLHSPVIFTNYRLNDAAVERYSELISDLKPIRSSPRSKRKGNAQLTMQGVYYVKGVLFFQFSLQNTAPIPYQIDFARSYIRDRRKSRRTSVTEKEIHPLYMHVSDNADTNRKQSATLLLAFDKFTIADNKHFSIEVFEKNGDRLLDCRLKGKDILRAKKLLLASSEAVSKE